jgi:hypothetical protein
VPETSICGHVTKTTDAPCTHPVAQWSSHCAAGHPVRSGAPSPPVAKPGPVLVNAILLEDVIAPADLQPGEMSPGDSDRLRRFFEARPGDQ